MRRGSIPNGSEVSQYLPALQEDDAASSLVSADAKPLSDRLSHARGIATRESIEAEAIEQLQAASIEASADNLETFRGTLIAYYFATHFSEAEIDDHINLARKQERFQNLQKVVNSEA